MNVIQPPHPVLDKRGEPHVRRFEEQRWLLDNIVRANGISHARSISAVPAVTRPTPISPASASA